MRIRRDEATLDFSADSSRTQFVRSIDKIEQDVAKSQSNPLVARSQFSDCGDASAVDRGFFPASTLPSTLPKKTLLRLRRLNGDDPDLDQLRKLLRKRFRTTIDSIRPRHFGRWLAIRRVCSHVRVAKSGRRSRSSRRGTRIAGAARRATADPDGASVDRARRSIAESSTHTRGAP